MVIPDESHVVPNLSSVGDARAVVGKAEVLGRALEAFRDYSPLVARRALAPDLAAKVGASDLVQETFLAAACGIGVVRRTGIRADEARSQLHTVMVSHNRRLTKSPSEWQTHSQPSCLPRLLASYHPPVDMRYGCKHSF